MFHKGRKVNDIKFLFIVAAAFMQLLLSPVVGNSATYQDVQDYINSYPLPPDSNCDLYPEQNTNDEGQTVYIVWKRCSTGEAARETWLLDGSKSGPPYRRCIECSDPISKCDGSNGFISQGTAYGSGLTVYSCHKKKKTIVYHCESRSSIDVITEQLDTYYSCMGEYLSANCFYGYSQSTCTTTKEKLKEFVIDGCADSDPCCQDPCACTCCDGNDYNGGQ